MANQKTNKKQVVEETKQEEKVVEIKENNTTNIDDINCDDYEDGYDCPCKEECYKTSEETEPKKKKWFTKENLKKAGKAVLYGAALVTVYSLGKAVERSKTYHDDFDDDYAISELSTADVEPMSIEDKDRYELPVQNEPVAEETSEPEQIEEHIENAE